MVYSEELIGYILLYKVNKNLEVNMKKSDMIFIPYIGFLALIAPEPFISRAIVVMGGVGLYNFIYGLIKKRKNTPK